MITGYIAEGLFTDYKDIADHAIQTSNGVLTIDPNQGSWVGDVKFKDISRAHNRWKHESYLMELLTRKTGKYLEIRGQNSLIISVPLLVIKDSI